RRARSGADGARGGLAGKRRDAARGRGWGRHGAGGHPVPDGPTGTAPRRRLPGRQPGGGAGQRAAGGADRGGAGREVSVPAGRAARVRAGGGALLVVGDVVTDGVARHRGPLAPGTDTVASVRRVPGGAGANVACWAARSARSGGG